MTIHIVSGLMLRQKDICKSTILVKNHVALAFIADGDLT